MKHVYEWTGIAFTALAAFDVWTGHYDRAAVCMLWAILCELRRWVAK